jgi:hypothetical protein
MILMGAGALLYEYERNDPYSFGAMVVLLIGIYGLLCVVKPILVHRAFSYLAFTGILAFMIRHCYLRNGDPVLVASLVLGLILAAMMLSTKQIFHSEVVSIVNFAFFFLYLHFTEPVTKNNNRR